MLLSQQAQQAPRHKTKLSVDTDYTNAVTSTTPSSPVSFVASPYGSPRPFEGSVPASPTFSGSWNTSKSQAELTVLLKEAYIKIRDHERDLMLAAEIGKSLLENNISLKAKYEGVIVQLQHLQRERSKAQTFTLHQQLGDKQATQIAPPNTSLDDEQLELEESETESLQGWSSSIEMQRSSSRGTSVNRKNFQGPGINYNDLEKIKDLEARNQELQQKLEELSKEYQDTDKLNKSKIRKLESDFQYVQESCMSATHKVEELEKENESLRKKTTSEFWNIKYSKKTDENDDYIVALIHKVNELEEQNLVVNRAKSEIERRLSRTTNELETLREEITDLMESSKNCEMLQLANRDQQKLIDELTENLEEQRALVVNYRSGMWSQKTSRANSISEGGIMSNALRRLSQGAQDTGGIGGKVKKTLLSEFESEWFRELAIFQRDVKKGRGDSDVSSLPSERDLNDFFMSHGARGDDEMDYLSDDEFSFLDEFELDNEKAARLREWFWRRWFKAIYMFLRLIWRWCRFIIILVAAVMMALYRGPDDILPSDM